MPNLTNASPAQKLAAVLDVVMPNRTHEIISGTDIVLQMWVDGKECSCSYYHSKKDDLARVVAMLTPKQVDSFEVHLSLLLGGKEGDYKALPGDVITAPVEKWVDALVAATGAEK